MQDQRIETGSARKCPPDRAASPKARAVSLRHPRERLQTLGAQRQPLDGLPQIGAQFRGARQAAAPALLGRHARQIVRRDSRSRRLLSHPPMAAARARHVRRRAGSIPRPVPRRSPDRGRPRRPGRRAVSRRSSVPRSIPDSRPTARDSKGMRDRDTAPPAASITSAAPP